MPSIKRKRTNPLKSKKRRKFSSNNVQQNLIGKSSLKEIKCRDQVFSPGGTVSSTLLASVVYIEPTVAGLGLATGYTCINTLEQGNGVSQRIGNKVVIKSIMIQGMIAAPVTVDATDTGGVRVIVVYDKQTNGAAPAITEIIGNVSTAGGYATGFNSPIKITNKNRFVVLRDHIFPMGGNIDQASHSFKWFIKKQLETTYSSTSSPPTVANITTGAIFLLTFIGAGQFTHSPDINDFNVRIRYED